MKFNLVQILTPLTSSPRPWNWKEDGKLYPPEDGVAWSKPWRSANFAKFDYDCRWEHQILHDIVFRQQAVAAKCMDCYKVVVFLDSLEDVYAVERIQQASTYPAKVGAETRSAVKGRRFGAYWYCVGLEEGQARYKQVKEWCEEDLTGKWKIILKRGCTEFEQHMGPSDKWHYADAHRELEKLVTERIVFFEPLKEGQPDVIVENVHAQWEEWDRLTTSYVEYQEEDDDS